MCFVVFFILFSFGEKIQPNKPFNYTLLLTDKIKTMNKQHYKNLNHFFLFKSDFIFASFSVQYEI